MKLKMYHKYLAVGLIVIVTALALAIIAASEGEEEVSEFKYIKLLNGYYASPIHLIFGLSITEEATQSNLSIKSWCSGILNVTLYGISFNSNGRNLSYVDYSIEPYGEISVGLKSLLDYLTIRSSLKEECRLDLYLSYEKRVLKYSSLSMLSIITLVIGSALTIIALYYKMLEKSIGYEPQVWELKAIELRTRPLMEL